METDIWQSRFFQERFEHIKDISCWIEVCTDRGTEHVVMILPGRARFEPCLSLSEPMLLERFHGKRGKHNAASSFVRLWLCFLKSFAGKLARNPRKNTSYL